VFICSVSNLPDEEILAHYTHRRKIEVLFKQHKIYMGFKSFMLRSAKAIDRLFVIFALALAHFFFIIFFDVLLPLSAALYRFRALLCSLILPV